jgi:autophagy-related protein 5
MQVPRHTYLPLLIPEIKENMVELALDDSILSGLDEKDWWFEEEPPSAEEGEVFAGQGVCKWYVSLYTSDSALLYLTSRCTKRVDEADNRHWPIDLIHLHSIISRPIPSSSSSSSSAPLKLRLHLSNPPHEKLNLPNNPEQCRTQWVNQVKEADFVRWRNTSRSTGLRRGEFDAGWDGIVNGKSASPIGRDCVARRAKGREEIGLVE